MTSMGRPVPRCREQDRQGPAADRLLSSFPAIQSNYPAIGQHMLDEAIVKGCKKADHGQRGLEDKHVLDLLVYMGCWQLEPSVQYRLESILDLSNYDAGRISMIIYLYFHYDFYTPKELTIS